MKLEFDSAAADRSSSPTERLVEACSDIEWEDVPPDEREHASALLMDFFGVLLGSTDAVESSRIARDYSASLGEGPATVAGESEGRPPAAAAFANGTISHGIELDDTHSGSSTHPGVVIIPAALAVAEETGATGWEFLSAVVGGYELMTRVGRAADPAALYDRGFHPTAVCGVFGAALTAARLRGLDLGRTVNAVGIAGSFAAGNLEYLADGTLSKRIQPGIAAKSGVIAAALAQRGYSGPRTILAGENGFLQGYSGGAVVDRLFAAPDDAFEYEIARTGVKPHACCRYNQTPIDCILALTEEHDVEPGTVSAIEVGLVEPAIDIVAEPREEKIRPRTPTDAQFSLPYSLAVALVEGRAFFEQFQEPYLSDDRVLSLAERVTVEHARELDEAYPDKWGARVSLTLEDGTTHEAGFETCRGDPGNMLPTEALNEKVRTLAGRQLNEQGIDELTQAVRDLSNAHGVTEVSAALRP